MSELWTAGQRASPAVLPTILRPVCLLRKRVTEDLLQGLNRTDESPFLTPLFDALAASFFETLPASR